MEGGVKKMTKEELKQKNKWFLKGGRGSGKTIRALYKFYGNRIEELEAQIEKMKCCDNCKHNRPVVTVNKTIKLSGELDYAIRYDVEHDLFHAQNVFSDEYITPTFVTYVQKLEQDLSNKKLAIQNRKADIERLEQENAELKARLQKKTNTTTVSDYPYSALKLEEAKEIIKKLVDGIMVISDPKVELTDVNSFVAEAEKFLKESEVEK